MKINVTPKLADTHKVQAGGDRLFQTVQKNAENPPINGKKYGQRLGG
ncbi:MAG: hypothetical protein AAGJ81_16025 [Verrucomicrobiota bacterium]